jgi:hypothetical protein
VRLKDRFDVSWQILPDRLYELLGDPGPGPRDGGHQGDARHAQDRHRRPGERDGGGVVAGAYSVSRSIHSIVASMIAGTSSGFSHPATISDDSAMVATRTRLNS